ncbi:beta strand repeat-containing protein [Nitrosophilus alvini]|uniref:beta strand repeat-containing protein n=1 Tax=Nitrosophilus alvini TaxID=2714855 RepID=UPI00190CDACD|nr:hypothetical protein [Nitrosophilus alvini]
MKGRKWMVSALLAAMTCSAPLYAEVNALSDSDLGEISAQGLQTVTNPTDISDQQNNNDSVQLNGETQSVSSSIEIVNSSASALNVHQNSASADNSSDIALYQSNDQFAENSTYSNQSISNDADATDQNNNNRSVQINSDAQSNTSAFIISNAAGSAENIGQNVLSADNLESVNTITQENIQHAFNGEMDFEVLTQNIYSSDTSNQNNNVSSVQLNENAQIDVSGAVVTNSANSAENIGQNIVSVSGTDSFNTIASSNEQSATNYTRDYTEQNIGSFSSDYQKNNINSVQLNDNAQNSVEALVLSNSAASASNIAQNFGSSVAASGFNDITQSNTQNAYNGTGWENWSFQNINNNDLSSSTTSLFYQDNLNAAVQLNDYTTAQNDVKAFALANTAHSASNIAQNVAGAENVSDGNSFDQLNIQSADNWGWNVQAISNEGAAVANSAQDNINGSVEILEGQNRFEGMALANTVMSASNIAQNFASGKNWDGVNIGMQENSQDASSAVYSEQYIGNNSLGSQDTWGQYNDNGSVQATGGQNEINALSVSNAAGSAQNIAQNVAYYESFSNVSSIEQLNRQSALSDTYAYQDISNVAQNNDNNGYQQNNNAAVQILGTQNNENVASFANSAMSAVNIGQNILVISDTQGTDNADQLNIQDTTAYAYAEQIVTNDGVLGSSWAVSQNNNNGAVQLTNAQNDFDGFALSNSVMSAVNIGQNIADINNPLGLSTLQQDNIQTAYNEATFSQSVINDFAVSQNNNNGGTQLNDSQNNVSSLVVLNSVGAAVSSDISVSNVVGSVPLGTVLEQITDVYTENSLESDQVIENYVDIDGQNNNNSSVQLNDSQVASTAIDLSNTAAAAHNYGNNIANLTGASGWTVNQIASQTAINR